MPHISEYDVESGFIERLRTLGYQYVNLKDYDGVLCNFREQLVKFNEKPLTEARGSAFLSDAEFERVLLHLDNQSVYESARRLRDKFVLTLDSGETVYLDFFSGDTDRNVYQVTHQVTMDPAHVDDVSYKNRYDVTVLINGLPLVQVELKRPGVEINEAINQINRYRKFSFVRLFRYIQLFVVSNSVQTKYFCNENEDVGGKYCPLLKSLAFFWTDEKNVRINDLDTFTDSFFGRVTLTSMLDRYMVIRSTEPVLMVMRPYQIYAVRAAFRRVLEQKRNGFVWACTGSGKTLTSFKLAQLLRDEPVIDRVIFLVDRKDLDDQTVDEYNAFEKDCVDNTDSTAVLVRQLQDPGRGLIVTTMQKMANAVRNPRYAAVMDAYRDKRVVFIIDECHRSQVGKMHALIAKHFANANYVGFTGTPIFEENRPSGSRLTEEVFGTGSKQIDPCLHRYLITNAMADGNVLQFSVEYQRTVFARDAALHGLDPEKIDDPEYCRKHNIDMDGMYHNPERIAKIVSHILEHHGQHVRPQGKDVYTALFAVDSIPTLGKYYDEFRRQTGQLPEDSRLRVAAVFTYKANEDMDTGADEHSAELLSRCMADYNAMFGTGFSIDSFDAYRKDIARRMKQKDLPQVDILLVVGMFLTGFDARPCNTLYLDRNLVWHSLLQAYSRTNRVDKPTKRFGQIITFRNIKSSQDDAFRLFSDGARPEALEIPTYEEILQRWMSHVNVLRTVTPTVYDAGQLQSEDDKREFVLSFREVARNLAVLKTFTRFDWDDLAVTLTEEEYDGYRSWYLTYRHEAEHNPRPSVLLDIDFDVELIRTDRINVAYIMRLLAEANTGLTEEDKQQAVDFILQEIERSDNEGVMLRRDLLKDFIHEKFFSLPADADVIAAYTEYEKEQLQAEIQAFATANGIDPGMVSKFFNEYVFSKYLDSDRVRRRLMKYHLGLVRTSALADAVGRFVTETYAKYRAEGD